MDGKSSSSYSSSETSNASKSVFLVEDHKLRSFQGYKVYRVTPKTLKQLSSLKRLETNPDVEYWTHPANSFHHCDIMVAPGFQSTFERAMSDDETRCCIIIDNVQQFVKAERESLDEPEKINGFISFRKYHRYAAIQEYLNEISTKFPKIVRVEHYGKSYENRKLTLVRISSNWSKRKPLIFIDGGMHAREWVTIAACLYIIHQLVECYNSNKQLLAKIDWLIVPLVNPDGYEYSHTNDRFWRKTRSKQNGCIGVDGNRNFDFHWRGPGASKNGYSNIYAGPYPFSEPETCMLADVIKKNSKLVKLYISVHSAAQSILCPWGFTSKEPADYKDLRALGRKVSNAIYHYDGIKYAVGSSTKLVGHSSGTSRDWVRGLLQIKYAYTFELAGGGLQGFDLPPSQIPLIVDGLFCGLTVFHRHIEKLYT